MGKTIVKNITKKRERIKIKMDTLQNYIINNNIKYIDVCKIDVEGAELEIMKGINKYINIVKYYIIKIENFRPKHTFMIKQISTNYYITVDNIKENWIILFAKRKF